MLCRSPPSPSTRPAADERLEAKTRTYGEVGHGRVGAQWRAKLLKQATRVLVRKMDRGVRRKLVSGRASYAGRWAADGPTRHGRAGAVAAAAATGKSS